MGWVLLITVDLFSVYSSVAFPGAGRADARIISDTACSWRVAPPKMPWLSTLCKLIANNYNKNVRLVDPLVFSMLPGGTALGDR